MLSLALFLMLLAFFIVLNTMTVFDDERVAEVRDSVKEVFGPDIAGQNVGATKYESESLKDKAQRAFDELEKMLKSQVGLVSIERSVDGSTMFVQLPKSAVYNLKKDSSGKTLAGRIADITVGQANEKVRFFIEVSGNVSGQIVERSDAIPEANAVGRFMRAMLSAGLGKKQGAVGLRPGDPKFATITFFAYRIDDKNYTSEGGYNYTRFQFLPSGGS